jgi:ribosomal protein L11 methyltransferase
MRSGASEIRVPPFWRIVPPGTAPVAPLRDVVVEPGDGWGTGAHETTRLCLQALGFFYPRPRPGFRMLDFGSGSGILSIGGALLGADVEAVEIAPAAIEHARRNARLSGAEAAIRFSRTIEGEAGGQDLVVANILRPILLEFSQALCSQLREGGVLILSGLVSTDVPELEVRCSSLLGGRSAEIFARGEWRAIVWR